MLTITVPEIEFFDEENQEFVKKESIVIELEHSLAALSKWESIWEKPFLAKEEKTPEELASYLLQMIQTPGITPDIIFRLSEDQEREISTYIDAKMTATWFNERQESRGRSEVITSELIYYWMLVHNIPWECEHWHLNRLFTLIKICNIKAEKPKKMSKSEMLSQRRALNAQRRQQTGSSG